MKKIKTINKLLSSLILLSPLSGIGFNNQYQNTQKVITENNSILNSYFNLVGNQRTMGGITVTVEGTTITGYVSGTGDLVVDSDITEIATRSFQSNENITSLDLSNATSLTTIGDSAFDICSNLSGDLVIPSSVTSIGDSAFSNTPITSLDLSQATSLTTIGDSAFDICSNLSGDLVIPSSVTSIGDYAFSNTPITSLDLSQATSLTTIGDNAFYYCQNLSGDLFIPQNLTSISKKAFWNASEFTSINIDPQNKNFSLATNLGSKAKVLISGTNDGIWNNNSIALIAWEDITIPSNVTIIRESAFSFTNITSLDLSQATNLTTIGNKSFEYCSNLTENIVIPSSVKSIGDSAFLNTPITSLDLSQATSLTIIGNQAFYYCTNLTGNITIPSSVTTIGSDAFYYSTITSLDFSQATSLTTIYTYVFYSCTNLSGDLVIPSSVTSIGDSAFENDTIDNLYFLSETPPPSFDASWQPTVTGKVYVPSEEAKSKYTSAQNFGFIEEQIEVIGVSGKALINIDEKSAGSEQYTTIGGFSVTKWEIVMTEGEQPEWLSIDNQGILSWTDQNAAGTYKFKIKATNDLQESVESAPITFVVNESIPPEPTPEKSNIPLILGLLIGLGIPVILEIAFIIWYLTKKKKQTVKI